MLRENRQDLVWERVRAALGPSSNILMFASVLIAAAVGALAAYQASLLMLAAPLMVTVIVSFALNRKVRLWTLSPVGILTAIYLVVGISGSFTEITAANGTAVAFQATLLPSERQGAYLVFVIAAASATSGALAYAIARPDGWLSIAHLAVKEVAGSTRIREIAGILSLVPLTLYVLANGTALLVRPTYLTGYAGDPLLVGAQSLALPAVAVLGWLSQTSSSRAGKIASVVALAAYATTLFALATRGLALVPLMAVLGMIAARPAAYRLRVAFLVAAASSIPLLELPLVLRASSSHGLFPYLGVMAQGLSTLDLQSLLNNVLSAFQLTGRVGFRVQSLPISSLLVSLDPRPGQLAGWYDVQPLLRLNVYTPYNALGELANYGWPTLIAFFLLAGAYLGHMDRTVRHLLANGQGLAGLLLFGLACLFIILTLQYNLRSCVRILYYIVALDLTFVVLRRIGEFRQRSRRRAAAIGRRSAQGQSG